jgi:transglutaminase-like putative cysteine protease
MRITITHTTTYRADPPGRAIQALRLTPRDSRGQKVEAWQVAVTGVGAPLRYEDAFGNLVDLVASNGPVEEVTVTAGGVVETTDTAGVAGMTGEAVLAPVFLRSTRLTEADLGIEALARRCVREDRLSTLHALLDTLHEAVAYEAGTTGEWTTAAEALAAGRGVCQDHAHVFISAARSMGIPARYVTGYLLTGEGQAVAHHAWAEALAPEIGWVGFDPANGQCPTELYVRQAVGLDATGAAPVRGIRLGAGREQLQVSVAVSGQSQRQQQ